MSAEIEDSTPLWFLLHNPRALGEVQDWLKGIKIQEQKTNVYLESKAKDLIHKTMWLQSCAQIDLIDKLLADIQKQEDILFPPLNKSKPIEGEQCRP
jgi:hypothetical protein